MDMGSDNKGNYVPAPQAEGMDPERKRKSSRRAEYLQPLFAIIAILLVAAAVSFAVVYNPFSGWSPDLNVDESSVKIIKSPSDARDYRFFILPNGLKVLTVSDPTADRAAASMDVSVGSFSDPEAFPGLAHFLEHMLFMGSKKYPDENQYSSFLSQHGGSSNAYTAAESTNYHFDIVPQHFEKALDIFAQFFISPLFREDSTEREVLAVENEHVKNLQSDGWRAQQLRKSLSNPKHPNFKFGTGNFNTLCNSTKTGFARTKCHKTREALRRFYIKHYSASRMCLAILSSKPQAELQALVRRLFVGVPNYGHSPPPTWDVPIRPPSAGVRMVQYVPIREQRHLSVLWELPPLYKSFHKKAGSYVSHLLGHEAKGSLAALLKKRGLIESLSAGASTDQRYGASFEISVSLTTSGFSRRNEVLDLIFQYIRLTRSSGPLEWVWRESANLAAMQFRFMEKREPSGYVIALASNLQLYPPKFAISAPYTYGQFDPQLIDWLLNKLRPEHADIFISGPEFAGEAKEREAIYGTRYAMKAVGAEELNKWNSGVIDGKLRIVSPNRFIPTNFSMVPFEGAAAAAARNSSSPIKLVSQQGARLWWKQDVEFPEKNWKAQPKVNILFLLLTPHADSSARSSLLSSLFCMVFTDAMVETTYDSAVAGLSWSVQPSSDGLKLSFSGYSDKILLLLQQVCGQLVRCLKSKVGCSWTHPGRFETMKDELRRVLTNSKKGSPYSKALEHLSLLLLKRGWTVDRLLYELSLPSVTLEAVVEHVQLLLSRVFVEGFVHGNAASSSAKSFLQQLLLSLDASPLSEDERDLQQVVQLKGGYVFPMSHTNPEDLNHALELYYQIPQQGIEQDVRAALLGTMISEPCFNQLRTKEQLGYIVACKMRPLWGSLPPPVDGISVIIQSSLKDPAALDRSARRFIRSFLTNLTTMSEHTFTNHKSALMAEIQEKETSMSQETSRLWREISLRRYDWDRKQRLLLSLSPVSLSDMRSFARQTFDLSGHSMAVWVYGKGMEPPTALPSSEEDEGGGEGEGKGEQRKLVGSISSFKTGKAFFPLGAPKKEEGQEGGSQ